MGFFLGGGEEGGGGGDLTPSTQYADLFVPLSSATTKSPCTWMPFQKSQFSSKTEH